MGVKNLWEILKNCYHERSPKNEILGIDASIWIHRYRAINNRSMVVFSIIRRIISLLFRGNKLLFVFDGNTPPEKLLTVIKRNRQRLIDELKKHFQRVESNHVCKICSDSDEKILYKDCQHGSVNFNEFNSVERLCNERLKNKRNIESWGRFLEDPDHLYEGENTPLPPSIQDESESSCTITKRFKIMIKEDPTCVLNNLLPRDFDRLSSSRKLLYLEKLRETNAFYFPTKYQENDELFQTFQIEKIKRAGQIQKLMASVSDGKNQRIMSDYETVYNLTFTPSPDLPQNDRKFLGQNQTHSQPMALDEKQQKLDDFFLQKTQDSHRKSPTSHNYGFLEQELPKNLSMFDLIDSDRPISSSKERSKSDSFWEPKDESQDHLSKNIYNDIEQKNEHLVPIKDQDSMKSPLNSNIYSDNPINKILRSGNHQTESASTKYMLSVNKVKAKDKNGQAYGYENVPQYMAAQVPYSSNQEHLNTNICLRMSQNHLEEVSDSNDLPEETSNNSTGIQAYSLNTNNADRKKDLPVSDSKENHAAEEPKHVLPKKDKLEDISNSHLKEEVNHRYQKSDKKDIKTETLFSTNDLKSFKKDLNLTVNEMETISKVLKISAANTKKQEYLPDIDHITNLMKQILRILNIRYIDAKYEADNLLGRLNSETSPEQPSGFIPQSYKNKRSKKNFDEKTVSHEQPSGFIPKANKDESRENNSHEKTVSPEQLSGFIPQSYKNKRSKKTFDEKTDPGRFLIDAIVTDDNDVFLFGAKRVYRNFFNPYQSRVKNKENICKMYDMTDINENLSLTRDDLIFLSYFLGSDYHLGVSGIGPKKAMKIIQEFRANERITIENDSQEEFLRLDQKTIMDGVEQLKNIYHNKKNENLPDIQIKNTPISIERLLNFMEQHFVPKKQSDEILFFVRKINENLRRQSFWKKKSLH